MSSAEIPSDTWWESRLSPQQPAIIMRTFDPKRGRKKVAAPFAAGELVGSIASIV